MATTAVAGAGFGIMAELGVPAGALPDYEEDLAADRYLLVVHGAEPEVRAAHAALDLTDTEELDLFV